MCEDVLTLVLPVAYKAHLSPLASWLPLPPLASLLPHLRAIGVWLHLGHLLPQIPNFLPHFLQVSAQMAPPLRSLP